MIRVSVHQGSKALEARETVLPLIRVVLSPVVARYERSSYERRVPTIFKYVSVLQALSLLLLSSFFFFFWHGL